MVKCCFSCVTSFHIELVYNVVFLLSVAVVGLEKIFYRVSEDVGVVEVCVNVRGRTTATDCPIEFLLMSHYLPVM